MSLFESIFGSSKSRFQSDMEEILRQVNLSFGKVQEGMRTYLLKYIRAASLPLNDEVIEHTFTWLISATRPPDGEIDLARKYVDALKTSRLVCHAFATAMVLKVNMLTSQNLMSEAMRIVKNLNELGLPPYSLDMRLPNERAFIQMAEEFYSGSKTMELPPDIKRLGEVPVINSERYEVRKEIGRGAFGVVHLAFDKKLGREVAIKRMLMDQNDPGYALFKSRFEREAKIIASLNHPNVVHIYDYETSTQGYSIVMEYIGGGSLANLLSESGGRLPADSVMDLSLQISDGLAHAHKKGIIHRDLKPQNVLIDRDGAQLRAKIADFGIARGGDQSSSLRTMGGLGTPLYMAPEQRIDAKSVTTAADIYSLGKMILEMLTGEVGFEVDVASMNLPASWVSVIGKCTQRDAAMRYPNADAFRTEFAAIQTIGSTP